MKERPILFSPEMVRAILEGRKTQTRRLVKPCGKVAKVELDWTTANLREWLTPRGRETRLHVEVRSQRATEAVFASPFGVPGDRLWVKETFWQAARSTQSACGEYEHYWGSTVEYLEQREKAGWHNDDQYGKGWMTKRPSIHMPRWASRLTLEVTDVRVQRLQDITEEDAIAEGIAKFTKDGKVFKYALARRHPSGELEAAPGWESWQDMPRTAVDAYARLWDLIHGVGSWDANPWVWAITFKVVKP